MKKQEATFKTEAATVVQEPQVGDVPPVVVTTMEQMTTTVISGQVGMWAENGDSDPGTWHNILAGFGPVLCEYSVTFKPTETKQKHFTSEVHKPFLWTQRNSGPLFRCCCQKGRSNQSLDCNTSWALEIF